MEEAGVGFHRKRNSETEMRMELQPWGTCTDLERPVAGGAQADFWNAEFS